MHELEGRFSQRVRLIYDLPVADAPIVGAANCAKSGWDRFKPSSEVK